MWLGFWVASGLALRWTLFAGTDGPTRGRLAWQSWSPLLPREARFLALPLERASSQGHTVHLRSPAHGKGSPSWKKREHRALYSVLIYRERRLTSCRHWEYYLIHYPSDIMGLLLKLSTLKTVCIRLVLMNNCIIIIIDIISHNMVKIITFGISSDRHVAVKASLAKSGDVIWDKNGHIK